MSDELKEALAEVDSAVDQVDGSLRVLRLSIKNARVYEDELDDLLEEVKSLKDDVVNLTNENDELEEQLNVLKKNLPAAERELALWRLQQK